MRGNFAAAAWRLAVFLVVCVTGTFVLLAVFAQFRFGQDKTFNADFKNVSGLKTGDMVRIAGVEIGKVQDIAVRPDASVGVSFTTDDTVVLTDGTRAAIRYDNLFGGRYLALEEGAGGVRTLQAGQTIPVDRTQPALDLDSLIGGFRPLFRALNPDQVNELSGQLLSALQGQGGTVGSFLDQAAAVTNTLANRDQLIGQVIDNLNVVLGSIGNQSDHFDAAVTSLSDLVNGLAARKTDISNAVAYTNAAAGSLADLLTRIAERQNATPAQIALGWLLAQKPWIVPIPGTTKLHRLEENIASAEVELTPDDLRELEDAQIEAQGARYSEANQRLIDR